MSVQVRRRREAASFLSTYVGAQGELLVDTTNNRVQVHDGTTPGGWSAAKLTEVAQRTAVADANYQALVTDRTIAFTTLTAARSVTLPAAAAYPTGTQLVVVDESGACGFATTITLARTGTDTINGAVSAVIATPYGFLALASNGVGKWTVVDLVGATTAQLVNRNMIVNGNFAINQRGYASNTSLAAGAYAHDRWKAGASGCTYTFAPSVPDTTLTLTAGSLVQIIEAANVSSATIWLTWTGTATARVWQGSASGAFAAGTLTGVGGINVNALLLTGLAIGTATAVEFGPGTVGLVQAEMALPNAGPTRYERRQGELALCQRYYQQVFMSLRSSASGATAVYDQTVVFPAMRTQPTTALVTAGSRNNISSTYPVALAAASPNTARFEIVSAAAGDTYALFDLWSLTAEL